MPSFFLEAALDSLASGTIRCPALTYADIRLLLNKLILIDFYNNGLQIFLLLLDTQNSLFMLDQPL